MTTPDERTRSVQITDKFLIDLLRQPRVPKWIRERARQCLRHFPTEYDMQRLETMDNAQMKKDAIGSCTKVSMQHECRRRSNGR